jgi:transmembrane sensor
MASKTLDAAIDWMVQLQSGEATAADAERHRAWREADPRHAQAWAQVTGAMQRSVVPLRTSSDSIAAPQNLQALQNAKAAKAALLRPPRRRAMRAMLGVAGFGLATGWLLQRQWPVAALMADLRTGTGERQRLTLADGSELVLNARSAVDTAFNSSTRLVHLRAGGLIASVTADAIRPFCVQTTHGTVQALGTRFLVRHEEDATVAVVLQHSVRIRTAGGEELSLLEGEAARFGTEHISRLPAGQTAQASWERGMLSAADQPLGEVIAALRPYREGFIRISPEAARLRVLGGFPLDNTDRAIESLAQTLPIRVTRYGSWLVVIDIRT